jgi:tagatose-1,6-bisphosphate aldolase
MTSHCARGVVRELDIDLLRLEYVGAPDACRRLASVLTRPWPVLSAGVPFDQFQEAIVAVDGRRARPWR